MLTNKTCTTFNPLTGQGELRLEVAVCLLLSFVDRPLMHLFTGSCRREAFPDLLEIR